MEKGKEDNLGSGGGGEEEKNWKMRKRRYKGEKRMCEKTGKEEREREREAVKGVPPSYRLCPESLGVRCGSLTSLGGP